MEVTITFTGVMIAVLCLTTVWLSVWAVYRALQIEELEQRVCWLDDKYRKSCRILNDRIKALEAAAKTEG